jgi:archaellum component FlaF (FlaF/FlaG flagellin family)
MIGNFVLEEDETKVWVDGTLRSKTNTTTVDFVEVGNWVFVEDKREPLVDGEISFQAVSKVHLKR